jgi:hypothetical protein
MNQSRITMAAWSALALGACSGPAGNENGDEPVAVASDSSSMLAGPTPATGNGPDVATANGGGPTSPGGDRTPTITAGGGNGGAATGTSGGTTSGGADSEPMSSGGESAGGPDPAPTPEPGTTTAGAGGMPGAAGAGSGGTLGASGTPGAAGGTVEMGEAGAAGSVDQGGERIDGVSDDFSFFVTSYYHIKELSGSDDGFGGNLSYGGKVGIEGADAICQEMASRVGFNNRTWRAYLSTSTVNAIDRVGTGPWYDFAGNLVAENVEGLLVGKTEREQGGGIGGIMGGSCAGEDSDLDRPLGGASDCGTYDELGLFHDGSTDQDNDGVNDDDHDTMTATLADGTYAGFSCEDWTSTTATFQEEGGGDPAGGFGMGGIGLSGGIMMGHSWPAGSGMHWSESHGGHACAAGTNFVQDGGGDSSTVGGGGGYGGFYCFALAE